MERPCCLDLYCGGGGAAHGLLAAPHGLLENGFRTIVGIDHENHKKSYEHAKGMHFMLSDVLALTVEDLQHFDFIWASPPCQAYCGLVTKSQREQFQKRWQEKGKHLDLIPFTRELLRKSQKPYIIENVQGSPLENPIRLCGTHFPGLKVFRHRLFESNIKLTSPGPCDHSNCSIGGLMNDVARPKTEKLQNVPAEIPDGVEKVTVHYPCRNGERPDYIFRATNKDMEKLLRLHYKRNYARSLKELYRALEILVPMSEQEKEADRERYERDKKGALAENTTQFFPVYGAQSKNRGTTEEWQNAIGAPFLNRQECAQAIPPAYSEFLGRQIMPLIVTQPVKRKRR